ncbi:MAG: glycogen debranching protein GlgX [Chloroflexi bacterium]|nr:glycogen debranching protein GlgX [Chloroflexota bacterium]
MADTLPGKPFPLGATVHHDGVNFSVFAKNCEAVDLLLFDRHDESRPSRIIPLHPKLNKTFYYWHCFVPGAHHGQLYGYRVHGDYAPDRWLRFDGSKVLVDPYARAVMYTDNYSREAAKQRGEDSCARAMKSVVIDSRGYDWEGDAPLQRHHGATVIYEMHVGGFTRHPGSGVEPSRRGSYLGLIDKISYLQSLGITAVELLPVQQFDEQDALPGLVNYWGYSPVAFFAPHRGYAARRDDPLSPVNEFREMVKALHRAGIEVILDVVFNHTAESDEAGPTLSWRGFEDQAYYILQEGGRYANYTGCGNTINGYHSIGRRMIMDCLHHWVQAMHVDGFRFDLASVLTRDEAGQPISSPPLLWEIESDPILAGTKIIAEAWDAAGLYQVGSFIGDRWSEWNGQYRDDARRFVKGDEGVAPRLAARLTGSPDLFAAPDRDPGRSINFITCHDGFTLNDLVSYSAKRNEANRQNNSDGSDYNWSWNCGAEGPSDDPAINALRTRQMKNLLAILLVSHGTPMLLMGDEIRRTQRGNNNAFCQNNETSWLDWGDLSRHADMLRFTREIIRFNRAHSLFHAGQFWGSGPAEGSDRPRVSWHGVRLNQPDWNHPSHSLAFELCDPATGDHLHIMLNAYWEPLDFDLPPLPPGQRWMRVADTALPSPDDIAEPGREAAVMRARYRVMERSVVVLMAK